MMLMMAHSVYFDYPLEQGLRQVYNMLSNNCPSILIIH